MSNGDLTNIRVVNLSLGKGIEESNIKTRWCWPSKRSGMPATWSSPQPGNYGLLGHFTITSPGNSRKIITVGSLTDSGTGNDFSDDYVSTYSSRGPTLVDHVLKPDLIAPGNRYVAAIPAKLVPEEAGSR